MAYITVADMRAEGVTNPPYPDADVSARIGLAQALIETLLHCWYEKRDGVTLKMNGRGHAMLWLPVPPVSENAITSVKLVASDASETEYLTTDYEVIVDDHPDGRLNPKLRKRSGYWPKGTRNIHVTGDFGFVDFDGDETYTTPVGIKHLCKMITWWAMSKVSDSGARRERHLVEEALKDYRYRLNEAAVAGMFGDTEIDNLLTFFKLPSMGVL